MSIELYPSIAKIKRNGVYENLPGFVPETGSIATQQMIASAESSATAQYAHTKGEYFRLNDTLYQAIVNISIGDSIVVGTNCEVAVIGNDLTKVANSIANYELGIATTSHNTGDYFMIAETMYVATADIDIGDSISTSTNCRKAVVGDELSEINGDISDINGDIIDINASLAVLEPAATSADVGKALIAKTVADGKVTAYEFGEAGGSGGGVGGIINTIENVPIASFDDGTDEPVVDLIIDIEPAQSGSGDPTPVNVRPITGFTGANIYKTGLNLLDRSKESENYRLDNLGRLTANSNYCTSDWISVKPDTIYYGKNLITQSYGYAICFYKSKSVSDFTRYKNFTGTGSTPVSGTFYPENDEAYIRVSYWKNQSTHASGIYYPDTYHDDKVFNGGMIPITFPNEAGTVFGGSIYPVKGKLYKAFDYLVLDGTTNKASNLSLTPNDSDYTNIRGKYTVEIADLPNDVPYNDGRSICSHFVWQSYAARTTVYPDQIYYSTSEGVVRWASSEFETLEEFNDYLEGQYNNGTPVTLVYPLASQVEYNFTGEEINTLSGYNNIWADTGNINLLKYVANGKQYVDEKDSLVKALIAKELNSMTADTALVENDFRIVNNTLYKITANIASGGTLTPNTNCVATTIGEVLKTLLT